MEEKPLIKVVAICGSNAKLLTTEVLFVLVNSTTY